VSKETERIRKADVTAALDREGARIMTLVRGLDEERVAAPTVGDWSPRDVLAHCVYWQGMLARMMGASLPPPSWIPRWQSEHEVGGDELNRLTVEHYRRVPLDRVFDDFTFTARVVRDVVSNMKEENLLLPAGDPWPAGTPVWKAIAGETHGHWKEHAEELERALK
jgi:uncharacterized protein DUF1706